MKAVGFFILFLIAGACVDRFVLNTGEVQTYFVVDGMISDQPGPYLVKLSRSRDLSKQISDSPDWVTGATVTITDDAGNSDALKEIIPGHYQTTTIQGVIGNTYTLHVTSSDGSVYESTEEKLLPVGEIKRIYYEFEQNQGSENSASLNTTNGFRIFIDAAVTPEQEGRVFWRWTGTFEIGTYPQLKTRGQVGPSGAVIQVPTPAPCSGYSVVRGQLVQTGDCTCCACWTTETNKSPLLSQPNFITGDSVKRVEMTFVPANRRIFYNKYYIEVEQTSLSQAAFDFWSKVAKQESSGSDLFQTPPAKTKGNVNLVSKEGSGLPVIGLFSAASIKTKSFTINHNDIPYYVPGIDTIKQECNFVYIFNTTEVKPSYY